MDSLVARSKPARAPLDFERMELSPGIVQRWLVPALSIAILGGAVLQLRNLDFHRLIAMTPVSPLFWAVFLVSYFFQPASEWVIFHRLWDLPKRAILPLLRKRLTNEVLLGYSGEVYFYTWARRNAAMVTAPFGAVKDVAILSAAVANVVTLVLVAACWPLLNGIKLGFDGEMITGSAAIITVGSLATMLFRRFLFSLGTRDLLFIAGVHLVRIIANLALTAALWAMIMPSAPLSWWLLLVTLRMLVSRLPLIPNKDLVFAGLAAFMIGRETDTTALVSLIAGLTLAAHLAVGAGLGALDLAGASEEAKA
ncbi:hypothetical protein FHS31_001397 [Sphingomonas vulcanisoli]|uniref:Flippase-like domain-containing protein n=1 Tax=Sphingomonas vulcanisoli TaxID=1658060 RepID=A0ABX0TQK7_9SPHN|nr:hypothetical protein [Sphingomonas vulcanisoli]NIJ07787.1 hypothetical protein [Sphingomonas vulcanisoli]